MPSITRIASLITSIRYNQPALSVVYDDLFFNNDEYTKIKSYKESFKINSGEKAFVDSIMLKDVSFRYPNQNEYSVKDITLTIPIGIVNVISFTEYSFRYPNQNEYSVKDITLTIPIGKSVAFVGESGAGKTTLVDIILGLFRPEHGQVLIDKKELADQKSVWQQKIGYIPQFIFLSDDTIRSNVAFGIDREEIDEQEVWRALEQAQLKEFIQSLPDQLDTEIGERGVRLSGGQRQRIGIARALYHNPEILFMDEATSALDNETEKEIMQAIDKLKGEKTLIIIAHRLSTIENCDVVFTIKAGKLVQVDDKKDVLSV